MKETDPDKADELCAEIWRVLRERDALRESAKNKPESGES
jgi:hypothetical protein